MMRASTSQAPLTYEQLYVLEHDDRCWDGNDARPAIPVVLRLSGSLDAQVLRRSLEELVRRHGSLRTQVVAVSGTFEQTVDEGCKQSLEVTDLRDRAENKVDVTRAIIEAFSTRRDRPLGPLAEFRLFKLGEREHLLAWAVDSIVSDPLSYRRMFNELWILYAHFVRDQPSPFKSMPPQYLDYALWQQNTRCAWAEANQPYWKERLAGALLPQWPAADRALGDEGSGSPFVPLQFDEAWTRGLREFARRVRAPLSLIMLAVYIASVSRLCNQRDLLVPLTTAGQRNSKHESTLGAFLHIMFLRLQLGGGETYIELLNSVTQEFCQAQWHQDFGRVAQEAPQFLWRNVFTWVPWSPDEESGVPKLEDSAKLDFAVESFPLDWSHSPIKLRAPYDIDVSLCDRQKDISGYVLYRADVFKASAIERFAQDMRHTLRCLVEDPGFATTVYAIAPD